MSGEDQRITAFHKPFEGRPGRLSLHGFCLLAPEVHTKLYAMGLHREIDALGLSSAWRRLKWFLQRGGPESSADLDMVAGVAREFAAQLGPDPTFAKVERAATGDRQAQAELAETGSFELMFRIFDTGPEAWQEHHCYLIAMEQASQHLLTLAAPDEWDAAVDYLSTSPVLLPLLWPGVADRVRGASALPGLLRLRVQLAWEAHLSFLAAWDVAHSKAQGGSMFSCLLPSRHQPGRNPSSLFCDELLRQLNAPSMGKLLARPEASLTSLNKRTVERWSAGEFSPDQATVRMLLGAFGLHQEAEQLYPQLWCTKHLNMLGYYAEQFVEQSWHAVGSGVPRAELARAFYPFEHETFEAWVADRYPVWLAFHRTHAAQVKALALSKGAA